VVGVGEVVTVVVWVGLEPEVTGGVVVAVKVGVEEETGVVLVLEVQADSNNPPDIIIARNK
jgi:hypothetical protein